MLLMKCEMLSYLLVFHISSIFNINLEANSHEKRELLDILDIFSLSMIPMTSTYHHVQLRSLFELSYIRQLTTFTQRSFRNID
jgi:hypothetical protein